jgi:AraC family transcriptional regulator
MYFTDLPDHSRPGFNELAHFSKFGKHTIIFNALGRGNECKDHVGCLSFKTVLAGEEWYGINRRQLAVRPRQFLILNNDQNYSCLIPKGESARTLSIFFQEQLAAQVFHDAKASDATLDTSHPKEVLPEFFQTLNELDHVLTRQITNLIRDVEYFGYDESRVVEHATLFLDHLIRTYQNDQKIHRVAAIRRSTQVEIFRRLCIAKDYLNSFYMKKLDLDVLSRTAGLSVPQLIRQFKSVFKMTPHHYLVTIRLQRAKSLLLESKISIQEIAWQCGFEDPSAFSRAFRQMFGCQPGSMRIN